MLSRIYGAEHEFAIRAFLGSRQLPVDQAVEYFFRTLGHNDKFLRNGARLYLDGHHPEYATPECRDLRDVIAHDKAGERIVEGLSVELEERVSKRGEACRVFLYKNNTDSGGHTYGAHENYLVDSSIDPGRFMYELLPFLAARQLMVGAGQLVQTPAGPKYSLSQRSQHMCAVSGFNTTHDRNIITVRSPHADRAKYRRLHLILGDSNMSETTTLLKFGSTGIVLAMIEDGISFAHLQLADPIAAVHAISADVTGRTRVALFNGEQLTALELLQEYLSAATSFLATRDAPDPSWPHVLRLWDRTLHAIERGRPEDLDRDIDWAIKWGLMTRYQESHGVELSHPRLAQLDLAYHDVRRSRGLYYVLEKRGAVSRVTTNLDSFAAKSRPPHNTRAALRGEFVKTAEVAGASYAAHWQWLRINSGPTAGEAALDSPFRYRNKRVARMIRDTAALPPPGLR